MNLLAWTAAVHVQAAPAPETPAEFTFLFWTDQEIDQGKDGDYRSACPRSTR